MFHVVAGNRHERFFGREQFGQGFTGIHIFARGHLHRPPHAGQAYALGVAGLEHPELALLDGKFHVLGVFVMLFKACHDPAELGVGFLPNRVLFAWHIVEVFRRTDTGDHVFALGVDQVFAHGLGFTRGPVARERHAGSGFFPHVPEDHRADVYGRAEQAGDLVDLAIFICSFGTPGAEDGLDREFQLFEWILGERFLHFALVQLLIRLDQFLELGSVEVRVGLRLVLFLDLVEFDLEVVVGQSTGWPHDHITEHIDESTVTIPGRAFISGLFDEAEDRLVGEAEVEDGIHHARHGNRCAGADRNKQRVARITEFLPHFLFQLGQLLLDLVDHARRMLVIVLAEISAGFGGNRKAGRDRDIGVGHLREVGALAAENGFIGSVSLGVLFSEPVKINIFFWSSGRTATRFCCHV